MFCFTMTCWLFGYYVDMNSRLNFSYHYAVCIHVSLETNPKPLPVVNVKPVATECACTVPNCIWNE